MNSEILMMQVFFCFTSGLVVETFQCRVCHLKNCHTQLAYCCFAVSWFSATYILILS